MSQENETPRLDCAYRATGKENRAIRGYLAVMTQLGKTLMEYQLLKIYPDSEKRDLGFRNFIQSQLGM